VDVRWWVLLLVVGSGCEKVGIWVLLLGVGSGCEKVGIVIGCGQWM
jgi:hypothetical protein